MNSLIGTFSLKDFDKYFDNYMKSNNTLAQEALTALEQFLPTLNEFFDLCEDLTDADNAKISWYSYANIVSSRHYIRAKSMYYNEPSFSDVSINMSEQESENYNTDEGVCFGKVYIFILHIFTLVIKQMNNNLLYI
jgi:hypothetical protein